MEYLKEGGYDIPESWMKGMNDDDKKGVGPTDRFTEPNYSATAKFLVSGVCESAGQGESSGNVQHPRVPSVEADTRGKD
jgi:hypothetical protein